MTKWLAFKAPYCKVQTVLIVRKLTEALRKDHNFHRLSLTLKCLILNGKSHSTVSVVVT